MASMRVVVVASTVFAFSVHPVFAQGLSRYREYALGSSVASVVKISGTRQDDVKTLHQRPVSIQQVEWRAPYVSAGTVMPDPVRDVVFTFYDDKLYQILVTYDRDRMQGLTNDDVIESMSATYGLPLLRHARKAAPAATADVRAERTVVAQWEDTSSLLTLTLGAYSPQYQLTLVSKTLNDLSRTAIDEALQLDIQEAPQREQDKRDKESADALVASQKARVANKAAFKP